MQLVKHFQRGYGHAERQISENDGRTCYIVRFSTAMTIQLYSSKRASPKKC